MEFAIYVSLYLFLHAIAGVQSSYPFDDYYWPSICPWQAPYIDCDPNPCHIHKCATNKKATCEPNHCGGCAADFYDEKSNARISFEECYGIDRSSTSMLMCKIKEAVARCEAHPNALAVCGNFYKYGRRLLPHECSLRKIPETCEDGSKPCKEDPCKYATCNSTSPTVICVPNYCKCSYHFVNEHEEEITCGESRFKHKEIKCSADIKKSTPVACKGDTCDTVCKAYPEAICIHECGSCDPTYYDRKGNKLGKDQCP